MDIPDAWKKAGKIAGEARVYGASLIKEDVLYIDVANKIDEFIFKKGGKLGFPVQLSVDGMAAHYTPAHDDTSVFKQGDLVKLDLGVQIDGYIGDTAETIEVASNENEVLVKTSKEALQAAIALAKPGTKIGEIGAAVYDVIKSNGFEPIRNLSGHGVSRWKLHDSPSVPNYDNKDSYVLTEGQVIAIEPFATMGVGLVREGKESGNFRLANPNKPIRDMTARKVLQHIKDEYSTLPFARRAIVREFGLTKAIIGLNTLEKYHVIHGYAQLPEKENGLTSQHEHTVMIADTPLVLTKVDEE